MAVAIFSPAVFQCLAFVPLSFPLIVVFKVMAVVWPKCFTLPVDLLVEMWLFQVLMLSYSDELIFQLLVSAKRVDFYLSLLYSMLENCYFLLLQLLFLVFLFFIVCYKIAVFYFYNYCSTSFSGLLIIVLLAEFSTINRVRWSWLLKGRLRFLWI